MGWYITLGVLALISIIPVGVSLVYHEKGLVLSFFFGFIRFKLYPKVKSSKQKNKRKQEKAASSGSVKQKKQKKGGKLSEFMPLIDIAIRFLGSLRKKLRVKNLELELVMAGDDPCDLAVNYGKAWAAVGNIIPLLESVFVIKKRNVQVDCDFMADTTRVSASLELTLTVGRVIGLAGKYGLLAIREYLKLKKAVL